MYIVGDLVMQQQSLFFLYDGFKCTFLLRMNKLNICATQWHVDKILKERCNWKLDLHFKEVQACEGNMTTKAQMMVLVLP